MGIGTLDADDVTVTVSGDTVTVSISYEKEPLDRPVHQRCHVDRQQRDDAYGVA